MENRKAEKILEVIDKILNRGNDVQIQRRKNEYVVMEVSRTIRVIEEIPCNDVESVLQS